MCIGGHSLGGALAQSFFTLLLLAYTQTANVGQSIDIEMLFPELKKEKYKSVFLRAMSKSLPSECCNALAKIKSINLVTFNGAGVRKTTQVLSDALVIYLQHMKAKLSIKVDYQRVEHDVVGYVGQANVCVDTSHDRVEVDLLEFANDNLSGVHTDYQFLDRAPLNAHHFFSNKTESAHALKVKLNTKMEPNSPEVTAVKNGLAQLLQGPRLR